MQILNKFFLIQELSIKVWFNLDPWEFYYWRRLSLNLIQSIYEFWKSVKQCIKQYIESVNKKGKEDSRRHSFYPGSPSNLGYVQSLTPCKDFTKKWSVDQVLQALHPAATHCSPQWTLLNLQQIKKPHRTHCAFQETPLLNPIAIHCYTESTV